MPTRKRILLNLVLFCKGEPLKRPRFGNGNHVYQPKDNQKNLLVELDAYAPLLGAMSIDEPIIIDMTFTFDRGNPRYKNFKGDYPTNPCFGDEDNLRKAVNDALVTKKIITDDRYVIGGETYKIFGNDDSIRIKIWSLK